MTITERVDASVDYQFKNTDNTTTIAEMEQYIFNARMRGADEETAVTFTLKQKYSDYSDTDYVSGLSVSVPATMGGFPVASPAPARVPRLSTRMKARGIVLAALATPVLSVVGLMRVF